MTQKHLNDLYFEWICRLTDTRSKNRSRLKLLYHLFEKEFIFILPMDANRADDGTDLRYRFAYENNIDNRIVAEYLDNRPCSILEMITALALKCEEHIMDDPEIGNRTGKWFNLMLNNVGLSLMDDSCYDVKTVDRIIDRFLYRKYSANGKGGLFYIRSIDHDMSKIEIWDQMCLYLCEQI